MILVFATIVTIMFLLSLCIALLKSLLNYIAEKQGMDIEAMSYPVLLDNFIYGFKFITVITFIGMLVLWIMYFIHK